MGSETDLELVAIAAVADNGVIGREGAIPWDLPEDMAHFERETTGHPVIMGRRTYEGILEGLGEPLPDRTSIVLTTGALETLEGVERARDVAEALSIAERDARERGVERAYVAGGASVYGALLPATDRLVLTEVDGEVEGDTYFPEIDPDAWREIAREEHDGFAFVESVRREGG
ncbi:MULTISPECIES: dihydrofolate reductase [Saliphagus]|uniref:dihydrofolate reductase n=1 Tax=Saliphagus infecundisoli TaxID=1849069 RepID=A0ABD5QGJ3_9EURY|nr:MULTISPECIES: dihydrofolate reductase [Saliphagus]